MASKPDEEAQDSNKSVEERFLTDENIKRKLAVEEERESYEGKGKLSENKQILDNENLNENNSDGEEFQDAIEDMNLKLNEKKDVCGTLVNDADKGDEANKDKGADEERETFTFEEKQERKIKAQEYKEQGNGYFKRSEYPEAKEFYTNAIKICPDDFAKEKSIFHANRAACLVKMDQYEEAIDDCTKALDLNSDYMKVRLRRAQCYEHEDRLEEALEDYQKVFDADRSSHVAREALMRLPEQIRVKHEKMKEEMMGKLKELGNVFLRPFGLSTENFKVQQDPSTGGYSVNFQK
ncbi:tetratricopeptide repeat protein 1-like [Montipora capricornis]|uniref:tetratricopeptide repeat protein 1-like n=1 Tax=Montipora capricornis TaxID=246305 RepID=UPI0035F1F16F